MKKLSLLLTLSLLILTTFAGNILILNNQMVFEGKVPKIKGCAIVFRSNGEKFTVPAAEIATIQFEDIEDKVYTDYLKIANGNSANCLKARLDTEYYHGKKVHTSF